MRSSFMHVCVKAVISAFLLVSVTTMGMGAAKAEADKPIIALLLADAAAYDGKPVVIYGLVIETFRAGKVFLLQDVSQMPLKVIRKDRLPTMVGDQILVHGVFSWNDGEPYIEASQIIETKVLGGGGCC